MNRLRHLIVEAHRRSLWQVLGVYLVSAWVVLQVVGQLTQAAGLPDWVPGFSLALLLIGLPIVLATAFVQEGGPVQATMRASPTDAADTPASADAGPRRDRRTPHPAPATDPTANRSFLRRHLTWPRALAGGVLAFTVLALFTGAYFVSWSTGIGPAGSLLARGEIERGERVVLADFGTLAPDTTLGRVVTDALRVDLLETQVLRVLEAADLRETLAHMQVPRGAPLTPERAREVALREGVKAVLEGEVAQAGTGFVLTATLRSAETGRSLAALRETAAGPEQLIAAIDRLSRRIRERAGESLRSINAGQPLERVTTTSLDALRLFSEANRAFDEGDYYGAIGLLDEAVALDPDFAMAWRRLGVAFGNLEVDREREFEAYTRAYQLRDRLSPRERHLAEARYYGIVLDDRDAMMDAYRRVLRIDPDDRAALNNLGSAYNAAEQYDAAAELFRRAIDGPGVSAVAYSNLANTYFAQGRFGDALAVAEAQIARYPDHRSAADNVFWGRFLTGDEAGARAQAERMIAHDDLPGRWQGHSLLAGLALWSGQLGEARRHLTEGERLAVDARAAAGAVPAVLRRLFAAHAEAVVGSHAGAIALVRGLEHDGLLEGLAPANHWHFFRANVLAMAGAADEAESVMRAFDDEVPAEHHARFWLRNASARSLILIAQGRPDDAIELLEAFRARGRCTICHAERMGWALAEAGRLEEAAAEWEAALTWTDRTHAFIWHLGQNLWVLQRIGLLYEELGDTARAVAHYGRLADQWRDADPELQLVARHARERIAALTGAQERRE
jgi:eukaryotic-like serine/threonine-protein kinase